MTEKSRAEKLAFTLRFLIKQEKIPGLLPKDVEEAAELLVKQEEELALLRKALATKEHVVEATVEDDQPYRKKISANFIITDPRVFYGSIVVDDRQAAISAPHDLQLLTARQLTRAATAEWIRELEERAYVAIRTAIAGDTRRAETVKQGSVA